ncbi:MAG: hypothetical protein ACYC4H_04880 [Desulfocucumaceae bacterium]
MSAKLYRVSDSFTGLKHCSTKNPYPRDYHFSGTINANSPGQVYLCLNNPPLKQGDIVVIDGLAYMWLKSGWLLVSFIEKAANT